MIVLQMRLKPELKCQAALNNKVYKTVGFDPKTDKGNGL